LFFCFDIGPSAKAVSSSRADAGCGEQTTPHHEKEHAACAHMLSW
jgi:hypothetical protein